MTAPLLLSHAWLTFYPRCCRSRSRAVSEMMKCPPWAQRPPVITRISAHPGSGSSREYISYLPCGRAAEQDRLPHLFIGIGIHTRDQQPRQTPLTTRSMFAFSSSRTGSRKDWACGTSVICGCR